VTASVYSWRTEFGDVFSHRRILVTGATGFIGGHLCEALHALGARLYALALEPVAPAFIKAERYLQVDLTEFERTQAVISEIQPDIIYHLAGLVTASQERNLVLPMLYNNLVSAVNILMAAADSQCERVVITGSAEELAVDEQNAAPTSPYAAAKAAATMYARMFYRLYGLPAVIVRLFVAYGPRQHSSKLIPYTILSLLRGERPKVLSGDRICDFIYVMDLVRGMLKIGLEPNLQGDIIELGTAKATRIREIVEGLVSLTESKIFPEFMATDGQIKDRSLVADIRKTRELLKWTPVWSLEEGLRETIAWYSSIKNQSFMAEDG